jgi:hypothetical protein
MPGTMAVRSKTAWWFAALLAAAATLSCASGPRPTLIIRDVTVIDVETGKAVPHRTVYVSGGRITAVIAAGARIPSDITTLDGSGKFLIPGLWDMHVHALWDSTVAEASLPLFVAYGVLGVRDMGGRLDVLARVRAATEGPAPRIVAAGLIVDGPQPVNPEVSLAVGTPDEARHAVDSLATAGVDFIKVYTLLPRDAYFTVLEQARLRRLPVAGHVPADVTPEEAARAGQRSMEHLRDEFEPFCADLDSAACDSLLDLFRERGVWQTPTLAVLRAKATPQPDTLGDDARLAFVPTAMRELWMKTLADKHGRSPAYWQVKQQRFGAEQALVRRMRDHQVPLLAGTDAGVYFTYPGSGLHDELELLVEAGLTPAEALRAATLEPARYLGATDSLGSVAPGRVADLVLLEGDPLADVRNTRRIEAVIQAGRLWTRPALEGLIQAARGR